MRLQLYTLIGPSDASSYKYYSVASFVIRFSILPIIEGKSLIATFYHMSDVKGIDVTCGHALKSAHIYSSKVVIVISTHTVTRKQKLFAKTTVDFQGRLV